MQEGEHIPNPFARKFEIARFYENLTVKTIGGNPRPIDTMADIEHPDWDSMVEVKASGSSQRPKVYEEQLDQRMEERGFPFSECCYAIWVYRNIRQDRITKKTPTYGKLYTELARRTEAFYLLDIRVLDAIREKYGRYHTKKFNQDGHSVVRLNVTLLRKLTQSPKVELERLGLNIRSFFVRQEEIGMVFRNERVSFVATSVLPKACTSYVWPIHRLPSSHLRLVASF